MRSNWRNWEILDVSVGAVRNIRKVAAFCSFITIKRAGLYELELEQKSTVAKELETYDGIKMTRLISKYKLEL